MVGRLVEDQEVGLGEDELAEGKTGLFAATESLGRLVALFAAEEHLAENSANVFDVGRRVPLVQPVGNREAGFDRRANILIFDEPTNHLDLEAINALNIALQRYEGTVLLVTHDHDLIDEVATRLWNFKAEGIEDFQGPYAEWKGKHN